MEQLTFYIRPTSCFNMFFWQSFNKQRLIKECEYFSGNSFKKHVILNGEFYTLIIRARENEIIEVTCTGIINDGTALIIKNRIYKMLDVVTNSNYIDNFLLNETNALFPQANVKIPGCFSVYEAAVRAVLGQQVSIKKASTLVSQFTELFPVVNKHPVFPEKEDAYPVIKQIACRIPVTNKKRNALIEITEFMMLNSQSNPIDINDAMSIKGVNSWTIDNIKLRGFLAPDIWMGKDLIIRKACEQLALPSSTDDFYNKFSPYRSYLTLNLWHIYNLQNRVYDDIFQTQKYNPSALFRN